MNGSGLALLSGWTGRGARAVFRRVGVACAVAWVLAGRSPLAHADTVLAPVRILADEAGYSLLVPLTPAARWVERSGATGWSLRLEGVQLALEPGNQEWRCTSDAAGCELQLRWPYRYVSTLQRTDDGSCLAVRLDARYETRETEVLAPGVEYVRVALADGRDPVLLHQVRVDPAPTGYRWQPAFAEGARDTLLPLGRLAAGQRALVGINVGYFSMASGSPLGLLVRDRQILATPLFDRSALLIDGAQRAHFGHTQAAYRIRLASGETLDVDALNRFPGQHQLTLITQGRSVPGGAEPVCALLRDASGTLMAWQGGLSVVPPGHSLLLATGQCADWFAQRVKVGDRVDLDNTLLSQWPDVRHVMAAGPRLLDNGQVCASGEREQFRLDVLRGRAPRSAIGIAADGAVLLVSVDGRNPGVSHGMTLDELARYLQAQGVKDALNLDGGGSTTLYVAGRVVNRPSDGAERPIHNALLLIAEP